MSDHEPAGVSCGHPPEIVDALEAAGLPIPSRELVDQRGWTTEEARALRRVGRQATSRVPVGHPDRVAGDTGYQEAARDGRPISQRPTPGEVARVRAALMPDIPAMLGITETELREYVRGSAQPEAARAALAILASDLGRGLWPRKVAAILWGLHLEHIQVRA